MYTVQHLHITVCGFLLFFCKQCKPMICAVLVPLLMSILGYLTFELGSFACDDPSIQLNHRKKINFIYVCIYRIIYKLCSISKYF